MITRKYLPSDKLTRFVKSYFIQEVDIDTQGLVIPALTQNFIQFHYGQLFTMLHSTGRRVRFYPVTVSGIMTTYSFFADENPRPRFLAVELQPYVPFLLFGDRVQHLVNSSFNGADLLGKSENFRKSLELIDDPDAKIDLVNRYLEQLFTTVQPFRDQEITQALEVMDAPAEYTTIETRLSRMSRNPRYFRSKFKRVIGVGPKLYMRIQRMEKVLSDMHGHPEADYLQRLHGFYDQPHFIRECRLFTGKTPTAILAPFRNEEVRKIHNNLA